MNKARTLITGIDRIIEFIGATMVIVTIGCTIVNIALRWTIGRSVGELDEISLMAFVWVIYVGMGLLYNTGEHICMDFVVNRLPFLPRIVVTILDMLVELVVGVVITFLAVKLMSNSMIRTTNVTHVPYAYLQLSIAIGFALFSINVAAHGIATIGDLIKHKNPFEERGEPK